MKGIFDNHYLDSTVINPVQYWFIYASTYSTLPVPYTRNILKLISDTLSRLPQIFQLSLFSRWVMSDSSVIPWTVAHQAPLSMWFPRQEYWSELPFPSPGDLSNTRIEPISPALAGRFFTTEPSGKPKIFQYISLKTNDDIMTSKKINSDFYISSNAHKEFKISPLSQIFYHQNILSVPKCFSYICSPFSLPSFLDVA